MAQAFKFELNKSALNGKIKKGCELADKALAEQVINDSDQFVPRLEGDLRSYVRPVVESGETYIVYDSPYAMYQWFGVRTDGTHPVTKYTTSNTGTEWVKRAERQYKDSWRKIAQKAFSKGIDG